MRSILLSDIPKYLSQPCLASPQDCQERQQKVPSPASPHTHQPAVITKFMRKKRGMRKIYRNNSRVDHKYKEPMLMLANRDHQHLLLKKVHFLCPACNTFMFPTRILVICWYQFIIKMRVKNENFLFQSFIHGWKDVGNHKIDDRIIQIFTMLKYAFHKYLFIDMKLSTLLI